MYFVNDKEIRRKFKAEKEALIKIKQEAKDKIKAADERIKEINNLICIMDNYN